MSKNTVYVVTNYKASQEFFGSDTDASNYAKSQSKGHQTVCTIYETSNGKVFFYENGEIVNARRKQELVKITEEIVMASYAKDAKQGVSAKAKR